MHHIISDISNPVNLEQYMDNRNGFKRVGLKGFTVQTSFIFAVLAFGVCFNDVSDSFGKRCFCVFVCTVLFRFQ